MKRNLLGNDDKLTRTKWSEYMSGSNVVVEYTALIGKNIINLSL